MQLCLPHSLGQSRWLLANLCCSDSWKLSFSYFSGPSLMIQGLEPDLSDDLCPRSCVLHIVIRELLHSVLNSVSCAWQLVFDKALRQLYIFILCLQLSPLGIPIVVLSSFQLRVD